MGWLGVGVYEYEKMDGKERVNARETDDDGRIFWLENFGPLLLRRHTVQNYSSYIKRVLIIISKGFCVRTRCQSTRRLSAHPSSTSPDANGCCLYYYIYDSVKDWRIIIIRSFIYLCFSISVVFFFCSS